VHPESVELDTFPVNCGTAKRTMVPAVALGQVKVKEEVPLTVPAEAAAPDPDGVPQARALPVHCRYPVDRLGTALLRSWLALTVPVLV
jgi:hypothetical protein